MSGNIKYGLNSKCPLGTLSSSWSYSFFLLPCTVLVWVNGARVDWQKKISQSKSFPHNVFFFTWKGCTYTMYPTFMFKIIIVQMISIYKTNIWILDNFLPSPFCSNSCLITSERSPFGGLYMQTTTWKFLFWSSRSTKSTTSSITSNEREAFIF